MSDTPKYKIYNVKDPNQSNRISKAGTFDLPMRVIICGKSLLSGKGVLLTNLLLRPWSDKDDEGMGFYKNDFEPDNIYIICPSTLVDHKWQRQGNSRIEYL